MNPEISGSRDGRALGSRTLVLTALALLAFAGNSLLCRLALQRTAIDAASFTAIRILSGALTLALIVRLRGKSSVAAGSWRSALALFAYAAGFSFAYLQLTAGTGALLLFGAVQATMIGYGLWSGERFRLLQGIGLFMALAGLVGLVLPGLSAPPLTGSLLMLGAGIAWGVYSLRGRGTDEPLRATAGNFLRAVPFALVLAIAFSARTLPDLHGSLYAVASGALTSGIGYALWYAAMRGLTATRAGAVQLSVPILAAAGGVVFLGETVTSRLLISSAAILGGLALVLVGGKSTHRSEPSQSG